MENIKEPKKGAKRIFCGAGMLALCSILAKLIGAFYRIPLTNILGSEGIGIHHIVYPLYTVLITVSSGGAPNAIARLIAANGGDKKGANKIFKVAFLGLFVLGAVASGLIVLLCRVVAGVQGNPKATVAYLGIAPAILCVALVSAYRGYFQGIQNFLPPSISQLIEQIIKVVVGLGLAMFLLQFGVEYGVLGGLIGVSVAEFGSLLILLVSKQVVTHKQRKKAKGNKEQSPQENGFAKGAVLYAKDKHILASEMAIEMDMSELDASQYTKDTDTVQLSTKSILSKLCKFALPITIGALILPMVQLLDSFVVIRFLMGKGLAIQNATAQFGVINGPVSSLVNMPVVITMALAVALMPKIAKEFKSKKVGDKDNQDDLSQEESKSKDNAEEKPADGIVRDVFQNYRFACVFSSLVALLFLLFAREIMQVLYNKGLDPQEMVQGVQLLRILSIVVVYISLLQISTAVMQGVGKPTLPTLFLGIGAVLKCIVGYSLMVWYGIYGILIATVVFYSFAALCNIVYIRKKGILIQGEKTFFVRLLLVVGVSGAVGWLCQALLSPLLTDVWSLFVGGAAVCMVFLVATLVTKVFGIKDFVQIVGVK